MAAVAALPNLDQAIEMANKLLAEREITVSYKNKPEDPKAAIPIQMKMADGTVREIGVVFLYEQSVQKLVRTTEQVAHAIIRRANLTLYAASNLDSFYISSTGMIFHFHDYTKVEPDGTILVNGKPQRWQGELLKISQLQSEDIIEFLPVGDVKIMGRPISLYFDDNNNLNQA